MTARIRPMRLVAAFCSLCLLIPAPALAQTYPFEGSWDCEVGTFTFTGQIYDPGDAPMEILDAVQDGATWVLTFADDYQIALEIHQDGTMGWFSAISGDSFLCRPLP
jgi:hypothetical protein